MTTSFTAIAAVLGFLGVALGAFGAHALAARWRDTPNLENSFRTGVQYHFYHTFALLATAWAGTQWSSGLVTAAGWLFVVGVILFSGSLYLLALTGRRSLGAITPFGGLAFLGGWLCLLLAVLQAPL